MLDLIDAAGWPIWPLIATSILGLGLIIERTLALRASVVAPHHLPKQVLELVRQGHPDDDVIYRLAGDSSLGRVLAEVLANRRESNAFRVAAIEDVGKDEAMRLNRYLPALATIAVVAPLMGLFGTVVGMIDIFSSYTPTGGDPTQLARGISVALYNTGFGILIAIPALVCHRYFRSRADGYLHRLEREANVLNRFLLRQDAA